MNHLYTIFVRFFSYLFNFGPRLTFYYIVYPRFGGRKAIFRRHEEIKRYIKLNFASVLNKYKDAVYPESQSFDNRMIWVCWLQGEANMPDIVRTCYNSVKANANGREVVLITNENVEKYISIPKFIKDKVNNGKMSRTHLADYIRISLLKNYGGLWIDATVFVSNKINIDCKLPFFSIKQKPDSIHFVSQYRWTVWILGCSPQIGKILFDCLENLFKDYLKKHSLFIDFFLFDYFLAVMYDEIPLVKQLVDNCPYNNPNAYELGNLLNKEFNEDAFLQLKKNNTFHKLSWKQPYFMHTADDKPTFYSVISKL